LDEWRYSSTHSLTSAVDRGKGSDSRPGCFTPKGKSPCYPLNRRLGGPLSRSGRGGEEKNSQPPCLKLRITSRKSVIILIYFVICAGNLL
jgi:hypothetical protein